MGDGTPSGGPSGAPSGVPPKERGPSLTPKLKTVLDALKAVGPATAQTLGAELEMSTAAVDNCLRRLKIDLDLVKVTDTTKPVVWAAVETTSWKVPSVWAYADQCAKEAPQEAVSWD